MANLFFLCLLFSSSTLAAPTAPSTESAAAVQAAAGVNASCTHGPSNRQCWSNGASVENDFDIWYPVTGNTVTYNFEITNTTCNPDGHGPIECLLVNGQYPGPTIRAEWGDQIIVNVKNSMQDNGTTVHFHGVRQLHTPGSDGVPGLTECPLAPGETRKYGPFTATQFGTSWYHSHYSSQYASGIIGPIVFDGPATANYDEDLGPYTVNEWYYRTGWQQNEIAAQAIDGFRTDPSHGAPPDANNLLINGTNKNANGTGSYNQVTITSGKTYRLRIISMAADNCMRVSLDGHRMTIISADFVPTQPLTVEWILLCAGQRYDVLIAANQRAASYWFRSDVAKDCLAANDFYGRAVWTYSNVAPSTPNTTAWPETARNCLPPSPLNPYWPQSVPEGNFQEQVGVMNVRLGEAVQNPGEASTVVWTINGAMSVNWQFPTMSYLFNGTITNENLRTFSYPSNLNLVTASPEGQWNYWLIQQGAGDPMFAPEKLAAESNLLAHPIHLHGHDFYILGQNNSTYTGEEELNFQDPTRRDTAILPPNGWVAIAFQSNNPGTWLMHCHIAWHSSEGFATQFLESPSNVSLPDRATYDQECLAWDQYSATAPYRKGGSGV